MAIFLLDTNILIDVLNNKKNRGGFLLDLLDQGHVLGCCPINVAEVYAGVRPKEEQRTAALLRSLQLFPITFSIAELAGRLKHDHGRKGKTLSIADTIIAAVAIQNRLTLITENGKDFPMKEVTLYAWSH